MVRTAEERIVEVDSRGVVDVGDIEDVEVVKDVAKGVVDVSFDFA